jgi:hypothetical protein
MRLRISCSSHSSTNFCFKQFCFSFDKIVKYLELNLLLKNTEYEVKKEEHVTSRKLHIFLRGLN